MKFKYVAVAVLCATLAASAEAVAAQRNPEARGEQRRDVMSRVVKILQNLGRKFIPVGLSDNIVTPKPDQPPSTTTP